MVTGQSRPCENYLVIMSQVKQVSFKPQILMRVIHVLSTVQGSECTSHLRQVTRLRDALMKIRHEVKLRCIWYTSLPSLGAFRRALKTELFRRSYGNANYWTQQH